MNDFAKEVRERREAALEADKKNREEAQLDLEFAALIQWDETTRNQRENRGQNLPSLPCLTIDVTNQLIGQVVGDRRANQTSIKVLPREDGDKAVAEVRSELIRSIELQSKAHRVYAQAFEQAVTCGIGNFRVDLDYAYEDAFDRDLFIRAIPNPLAVIWDPMAGDPTGRDAEYCFVEERIRKEDYKARFGEKASDLLDDKKMRGTDWVDDETVLLAEYWQMAEQPKTVAMDATGKVIDVTDQDVAALLAKGALALNPSTGEPYVRETKCKYANRILTNGKEPLEEGPELKLPRLPIIKVTGHEIWVGNERVRFGLIRPIRDQQRLKNYLRSVAAEKLMFAPRHSYIVEAGSIAGMEADYGPNILQYAKGAQPPQEATMNNLAALIQMSEMFAQDMKDGSGIHDASLGARSNETSGVAIRARQHQGDISTILFSDNMDSSQQEAGEVCNELIPHVFDTTRTIRTVGEDDSTRLVRINDPSNPEAVDLGMGKYDVTVSTGPAYMTKRIEAAAQLSDMAMRSPELLQIAGDLIVRSMDIPDGDKIADRIKKNLDPKLVEDEEEPTPEQMQARMAAEAEAQEMKSLARRKAEAEVAKAEAEAAKAGKEAEDALAGLNKQTVDATNAETARLKAITAKDFPLPPEAVALLTPIVTNAIAHALASPDALPFHMAAGIAASTLDAERTKRDNEEASSNAALTAIPDINREGAEL